MMGASLNYARLDGASLSSAQLQGALLQGARLDAASLSDARLDGASLFGAYLTATMLFNARLRGADFTRASMFGAVLDQALAHDASFQDAQMQGVSMQRANFSGAKFHKTSVFGTDVSGALFKGALIKDVSASRRWEITYGSGYADFYPQDTDPFGKEGDDAWTPAYENTFQPFIPAEIPVAEQDRLAAVFPGSLSPDPLGTEVKNRLAHLAPNSKTADWTKLTDNSTSEAEFIAGLGERLIVIACARAGEGHVARGLIRSRRLCPYKDKVEEVLKTGLMTPNGKPCADTEGFKRIWNEAMQSSPACDQNAGRP